MEKVQLEYYYNLKTNEELKELKDLVNELQQAYNDKGYVFVEILAGQKKGSIAKLVLDEKPKLEVKIKYDVEGARYDRTRTRHYEEWLQEEGDWAEVYLEETRGNLKWDGKSNKPKGNLYNNDIVWLKGYEGETVWKSVTAKERRKEALEQNPEKDIDGNILKEGDKVLYINARYGSGMVLQHGIIDRFDAEYHAHDNTVSIYTIVKNSDNMESKILYSNEFICLEGV